MGQLTARLQQTHIWHLHQHLDHVKWSRLAATITLISFLALFPLLTLGTAVTATLLSTEHVEQLQHALAEQVPGISDQLDLQHLIDNAHALGAVAGALLLLTGITWVGHLRDCLRAVWETEDAERHRNPLRRKLTDITVLLGLGAAGITSWTASTLGSTTLDWSAHHLGIDHSTWSQSLLQTAALTLATAADFLLLLYVLTLLPAATPPRRRLFTAAALGAAGFELLKLLLSGYMKSIAAKNMYGAFGVPVALLLWINLTARLVLVCTAWTATSRPAPEGFLTACQAPVKAPHPCRRPQPGPSPAGGRHPRGRQDLPSCRRKSTGQADGP